MPRLLVPMCLLALAAIAVVGCSDETKSPEATPVSTAAATTAPTSDLNASPSPTALISIDTPEPVEADWTREPLVASSLSSTNVTLARAQTGSPGVDPGQPTFDRIAFQFDLPRPAYDIQYVQGPIQNCASGQTETIAGNAFLQIKFTPAVAHDEQGNPTVATTDISQPGLTLIQQAKQICDFEGVVTWVLGLSQEADFRTFAAAEQLVVVDVKHP